MSEGISRRKIIATGLAAGGVAGLAAAAKIAAHYGLIPPDSGGMYGVGETLTYATQRLLMSGHSMAREFNPSEVSKGIPVSGEPPETEEYHRLLSGGFADRRLKVDGMVARPASFSLADLKRMPMSTQITHQACEEGWSFIAQWNGVKLSHLLSLVGVQPEAKYVVFFPYDESWDSLDMADAYHPQSFLVYGLNGEDLPTRHGAPVRVRVARQLGYKSVKYLTRITATNMLKNIGKGLGSAAPEGGYSWYPGI
jgi:DMSO/TMAO reductase YedYZ molybdopterin-dependent catalytic subunit